VGSIAAVVDTAAMPRSSIVVDMLAASPHRGARTDVVRLGATALGIASQFPVPGRPADAWVACAGGVAVAVAGVVDNLEEAVRVRVRGAPTGGTPAELLLALFSEHGTDAPKLLRGAYAAVVSDGHRLLCFRDHLGFAPLFYRDEPHRAYVASEARQIVVGAGLPDEPDLEVIEQIFFQTYDDDTGSARRGVRRLRKSSVLALGSGSARTDAYWEPARLLESARYSTAELQERFDSLMQQAADRVTTAATAVSLSGGVDSPAVAAFATRRHVALTGQPLAALTAVYPDHPAVDEYEYTRAVADYLGLELHTYEQGAHALDDLAQWVARLDGPVPSISLPQYAEHYRVARSLGASTVLSGEIAEYVFDLPQFLAVHLLLTGRLGALGRHVRARRRDGASWGRIARAVGSPLLPLRVARERERRRRAHVPVWLDHRRVNEPAARSLVRARDRWRKVQLSAFEGPGLTSEAEEVCQQVTGVVARRPFADVDLWELFLSLPADQKFPDPRHKALVRSLLRGHVPDIVLDRRDKTLFDDSVMAGVDYGTLRTHLLAPNCHLGGVDYRMLAERLEQEALTLPEYLWAKDLASAHAFLGQW